MPTQRSPSNIGLNSSIPAPVVQRRPRRQRQEVENLITASSNRPAVLAILSRYFTSAYQCNITVNRLDSIPEGSSVTLTELVKNIPSKHRPPMENRLQMLAELENSGLFKFKSEKRNIVIEKGRLYE